MRRFLHLFLGLLCSLPWALLVPVRGDTVVPPVIHGQLVLGRDASTYTLDSVIIAADGELKVLSGVKLLFNPGATIQVAGKLTLAGTTKNPITMTSVLEGAEWGGISSECASVAESLANVVISSAKQGVQLCSDLLTVHDITIRDSTHTSLTIGAPGFVYPQSLTLGKMNFLTPLIGQAVTDLGLHFIGDFLDILIAEVHFPHLTAIPPALAKTLFTIVGTRHNVITSPMTAGTGCYIIPISQTPGNIVFGADSTICPQKTVPVVFVPGYGTSINLKFLAQSNHQDPNTAGWRFISALTPQYDELLHQLDVHHVPYKVAYYDWRQSPAVIASAYLKPVIDQAKQDFHSDSVNLVTHSFGGIVAREYMQSSSYEGDVDSLFEIAAPNAGALKAYPVWEAGSIPGDWEIILGLIRLYQLEHLTERLSVMATIQRFFPSVQALLPTYTALTRNGSPVSENSLSERNTELDTLNAEVEKLTQRVRVITVASNSQDTDRIQEVSAPKSRAPWKDGQPSGSAKTGAGDGTVLTESVESIPGEHYQVSGTHLETVSQALSVLFTALYPNLTDSVVSPANNTAANLIWFFLDCPVIVTITTPNGEVYSSDSPQTGPNLDIDQSDSLIWLGVPAETGQYSLHIQATADTAVRWWEEEGDINELSLQNGEVADAVYTPVVVPPIAVPPDPVVLSAAPAPVVTPAPSSSPVVSPQAPVPSPVYLPSIVTPEWTQFSFHSSNETEHFTPPSPITKKGGEIVMISPQPWKRKLLTFMLMCVIGVFLPP